MDLVSQISSPLLEYDLTVCSQDACQRSFEHSYIQALRKGKSKVQKRSGIWDYLPEVLPNRFLFILH